MKYEVEVTNSARRQIERLPKEMQSRILTRLLELENNPRPEDSLKLKGFKDTHRIRIGNYRAIYEIHDKDKVVVILKCMHRREIYR